MMNGSTPDRAQSDLGAVLEHVGVLGAQQDANDPPVQPEDQHNVCTMLLNKSKTQDSLSHHSKKFTQ